MTSIVAADKMIDMKCIRVFWGFCVWCDSAACFAQFNL